MQVFSPTDVWVFGASQSFSSPTSTVNPYAANFNGSKWQTFTVPGSGFISSVSAASKSNIWAVVGGSPLSGLDTTTSSSQQTVVQWTGSAWQQPTQPTLASGETLSAVLAESGGKVLVAGSLKNSKKGTSPMAITWNGTAWSARSAAGASSTKWGVAGLVSDGHGGAWATADASNKDTFELLHLTGTKWTVDKPDFGKSDWILLSLSLVPHSESVWGAGAVDDGSVAAGLIAIEGATPK